VGRATPRFTIEAVVLGRNDDYEPGWVDKLNASIRYNHRLLEARGISYRVAFVEWNPPAGRDLLAPGLVASYPFVRGIIVDREVHEHLCTARDLDMMLNFAYNPALRTSSSHYSLITSGDLFFGRALADRIAAEGLRTGCLYRAERVNIDAGMDVLTATPDDIEAPTATVSVDSCSEPPYDVPPYSHASGDFLMVDRATMHGLRGFDESIRFARLHLDSRFCFTAMAAGLDCELLGRIYHINHRNAYTNRLHDYPGQRYDYMAELPYLNPRHWGLARYQWSREHDRLWRIAMPVSSDAWMPGALDIAEVPQADAVTRRLMDARARTQPSRADADEWHRVRQVALGDIRVLPMWENAAVEHDAGGVTVTTVRAPWGYSAWLPLTSLAEVPPDEWAWVRVQGQALRGVAEVGLLEGEELVARQFVDTAGGDGRVWLRCDGRRDLALLVRNGAEDGPSQLRIDEVAIVAQHKLRPRDGDYLLDPTTAGAQT
jgi:hypothetical protein